MSSESSRMVRFDIYQNGYSCRFESIYGGRMRFPFIMIPTILFFLKTKSYATNKKTLAQGMKY